LRGRSNHPGTHSAAKITAGSIRSATTALHCRCPSAQSKAKSPIKSGMTRWGKIAGFGVSVSRLRAIGPKFIPSLTRGSTRTESGARHEPRLDAGRERRGSVRNARCRAGHARSAAGDAVEWGAAGHAFGRCYCEPDRCRASLALGIVPRWSSSRACREAREERVGRGGLGQPPRHKLRGQEDARLDPLRHNGPPAVWCRLPHTPPAQRKAGSPIKSGMTKWGREGWVPC